MHQLTEGDEFTHTEHGEVVVTEIVEKLETAEFTDTGDELVFEGGTVDSTSVRFYSKKMGQEGTEELMSFCESVGFPTN